MDQTFPIKGINFYNFNVCHVCKAFESGLKRCSSCKLISYCSRNHQELDWPQHRKLCKIINKLDVTTLECKNLQELRQWKVRISLQWIKQLGRPLKLYENQMWLFYRVCNVCYSNVNLTDCETCGQVSYCSEEHKALDVNHGEFCELLKLGVEVDCWIYKNGLPIVSGELGKVCMPLHTTHDYIKLINEEFDRIRYVLVAESISPIATIINSLKVLNTVDITDLTIHLVGCAAYELTLDWTLNSEFLFHLLNRLETLKIILIGPDMQANENYVDLQKTLCQGCLKKGKKSEMFLHKNYYQDIVNELEKPDIVVALNSGLHEFDGGAQDTWQSAIECLVKNINTPLLLTAYTEHELKEDINRISRVNEAVEVVCKGKNQFGSLRPLRDWSSQKNSMSKLITLTVLMALATAAWGYSAGAPDSTCDDMTPKHPVDPQKSESPYTVSVSKNAVAAGDIVDITVSGKPFKGVLVQVRQGDKAVGSFEIPDTDKYTKAITCHGNKNSAATHKNSTDKKDLVFKWKAPQASGNYVVYLTAALDGGTFWVRKPTQTIKVN